MPLINELHPMTQDEVREFMFPETVADELRLQERELEVNPPCLHTVAQCRGFQDSQGVWREYWVCLACRVECHPPYGCEREDEPEGEPCEECQGNIRVVKVAAPHTLKHPDGRIYTFYKHDDTTVTVDYTPAPPNAESQVYAMTPEEGRELWAQLTHKGFRKV